MILYTVPASRAATPAGGNNADGYLSPNVMDSKIATACQQRSSDIPLQRKHG